MSNFAEQLKAAGIIVVGVSGKLASGKTTLCNNVKSKFATTQFECTLINFADPLKKQVAQHTGLPLHYFYTDEGKRHIVPGYDGMTVGQLLQAWGTALRTVHPNIWVNAIQVHLQSLIECADSLPRILLIGDVRFANEFQFIKQKCGGIVLRTQGDPSGERARSTRDLNHISECDLDIGYEFDIVIDTQQLDESCAANAAMDVIEKHLLADSTAYQDVQLWYKDLRVEQAVQEVFHERILPLFSVIAKYRIENDGKQIDPRFETRALWDYCFHTPFLSTDLAIASLAAPFFTEHRWNTIEIMAVWLGLEAKQSEWSEFSNCAQSLYWSVCEWHDNTKPS